jgi:hypothetical protein
MTTAASLAADMVRMQYDPLAHARYAYPWGTAGTILERERLRAWQEEELAAIGQHLRDPLTRHQPYRSLTASGHGIGKSALVSMIVNWALDTLVDTRVVVTANTEAQIRGKTWPEVVKWRQLAITRDWWQSTATAIFSREESHQKSWRADAVTWSKNNTEAFAGLHNKGRRILLIFDEASGIDDKVWEVAQGALTDEDTEILWIGFGNPTKNTGRFREGFGRLRHLWRHRHIDSRTVEGTNTAYLQEIVDTYGEDSDIARVRVRGQFPRASAMQFISAETVALARKRPVPSDVSSPLIYGVDTARYGDDKSVLAKRRGRDARSYPWRRWTAADTFEHGGSLRIVGDINRDALIERPVAIFVDAGGPNAGAVIDGLRALGHRNVFEVSFGAKGGEAIWQGEHRVKTWNKRATMWTDMRSWLTGGCIPDSDDLEADLVGVEYGYAGDQMSLMLEKKEHMKERGLASPDDGDALALTFAEPVMPVDIHRALGIPQPRDYDPLEQLR